MRDGERKSSQLAKTLRQSMTPAEALLWSRLRRTPGLHFRRQYPIGPFIADFACVSARLVIEVDGSVHESADAHTRDKSREAYLMAEGWHILRISNRDVFSDVAAAVELVRGEAYRLLKMPPPPLRGTSPAGGGGE